MSKPQKKPLQPWAEQMIEAFHLAPLDDDEYFVQWETGRLGVNISEDKESELPYVSKITDANSPLAAAMEVGDYLLCVNELRAEENSFNNFLRLLTTKQKPVLLRFRRGTHASRSRILANHDAKYPAPASSSLQRRPSKDDQQLPSSSSLRPISTSDNAASNTTTSRLSSRLSPSLPSASTIASMFTRATSVHQGEATSPPVPPQATIPLVERRRATSIPENRTSLPPPPRPSAASTPSPPSSSTSTAFPRNPISTSLSSSSSDDPGAFVFSWVDGPLGVYFGEDENTQLPIVTRTLPHASPLITANVQVGDTLVSANGLLSRDHPFGEFFAALQKMSKPIQLVFAPSTAPESDDESTSGRHSPTHSDDVIVRDPVDHEAHRPRPPPPPRSPASRVDLGSKEHAAKGDDRESKSPAAAVSPEQVLQYPPPSPKAECSSGDVSSPAASVAVAAPVPVPDERPYMSDDDDDVKAALLHGHSNPAHASRDDDDDDDDGNVITDVDLDLEPADDDEDDDAADAVMPTLEFIKGAPPSTSKRQGRDSPTQTSSTTPLARPTTPLSSTASGASNSSSGNNERTGGSRRGRSGGKSKRNFTTLARLPRVNELEEQTIALVEPNSVNMKLTVRGRLKSQRVSKADTPDSSMYLIKWKENRSIGVQLRECRLAKGVYPMVVLVCREACCESLRHVQIGDLLVEINGRDTAMMSVKKTIAFVKTCTKTALLKFKRGPGISVSRVSA